MIYVGGAPLSTDSESPSQGSDTLFALMEHPILRSASSSFNDIPQRNFTISDELGSERSRRSKCVYVFQREYATVDPAVVDLVGTDEATTCVGLAIRNRTSGMISVGHMDSPDVVDIGLAQMLTLVVDQNSTAELDVHLVGSFDDVTPQNASIGTRPESKEKMEGYSFPLCTKIVEALQRSGERFHLNMFHVLWHNTRRDSQGNACPIFHGFLVETSTGSLVPTTFDRTSRCPDEIVRRVRLTACSENPRWNGKLIETYDTQSDRFIIAPFSWTRRLLYFVSTVQQLSDSEILSSCSTSPFAEVPDFVDNERRLFDYLIQHPDWRETFPMNQPRIFERTADGTWIRQGVKSSPA